MPVTSSHVVGVFRTASIPPRSMHRCLACSSLEIKTKLHTLVTNGDSSNASSGRGSGNSIDNDTYTLMLITVVKITTITSHNADVHDNKHTNNHSNNNLSLPL